MNKTKLIVHIGTGSTGASSIQATLKAGAVDISDHGVVLLFALDNQRSGGDDPSVDDLDDGFAWTDTDALFTALAKQLEQASLTGRSAIIWSDLRLLENHATVLPALIRLQALGGVIEVQSYSVPDMAHDQTARDAKAEQFQNLLSPWRNHFKSELRVFNSATDLDRVALFLAVNGLPNLPQPLIPGPPVLPAPSLPKQPTSDRQNHLVSLSRITAERNALVSNVAGLQMDLAGARKRPWKLFRDWLKFRVLTFLARQSPPIPAKVAKRLAKSARKRDPDRSLPGPETPNGPLVVWGGEEAYDGLATFDPNKPNLLMVCHEATRTGAPILGLNLVQSLAERYNVTTLCLRGGDILDSFLTCSVKVQIGNWLHKDPAQYTDIVTKLCRELRYDFAIVNSLLSEPVLKSLKEQGLPTVSLIHEFALTSWPKLAFAEVFRWSDHTVFSSRLTLENALETAPFGGEPPTHLLPQGKCIIPVDKTSDHNHTAEHHWLRSQMRPENAINRRFVVLGAGMVEFQKGVDLFIEVARRVIGRPGGETAYFFWIGGNYDPENDLAYSVYLRDQLARAGVGERVKMLRATSEIEFAYELADVLLLPSRLDPMPNAAIDALTRGMPVLCFENATGIADFLGDAGLKEACVASYIDTRDLADKVLALASSAEHCHDIGTKSRTAALKAFDFATYAGSIEHLGVSAMSKLQNKMADVETILDAGTFRPDFHCPPGCIAEVSRHMIESYALSLGTRSDSRRPEPGFHPNIYRDVIGSDSTDSYADFLRKGRPTGPWMLPVITGGSHERFDSTPSDLKSALHVHAFYTAPIGEIIQRLHFNRNLPDLFVSVGSAENQAEAADILASYRGKVARIEIVPNSGRDIGPFLTFFGNELVKGYDVIGHVHVKKSGHVSNSDFVSNWVSFLHDNVLGGKAGGAMFDRIIAEMSQNDRLGLVYPEDPHIISWTQNRRFARELAKRMGFNTLPNSINFPVGTMFWMRSAVLKRFTDLGLAFADYPPEPLPNDGTMLHALERLFGVIPSMDGWDCAVTNVFGVTR